MTKRNRTRVIGYCRVSTEGQADDGCSLEAQRAKLTAYAALYDLDLVEVVEDAGLSGKSLDRPGLARALARLEAGEASGIVVASLSRLTRRVRDLGVLLDAGFQDRWSLMSVAEQVDTRTSGGRLVLNVLASVSEWERDAAADRTRDALAHLKAQGVKLGGEALGLRRGKKRDEAGRLLIEEVRAEARAVSRILELHEAGRSFRDIAAALTAEGLPTKQGGAWHHQTVSRVIRRALPS
jgi:site-specific DNA recombinase